jgi:hypothetical protein
LGISGNDHSTCSDNGSTHRAKYHSLA